MNLTDNAKKMILENMDLRHALLKANSISEDTLLRWLRKNYAMLTTKENLLLIAEHTKLKESQILEKA